MSPCICQNLWFAYINLMAYRISSNNSQGRLFEGRRLFEGEDYFKYFSQKVVPKIFCLIIPLNQKNNHIKYKPNMGFLVFQICFVDYFRRRTCYSSDLFIANKEQEHIRRVK